MCVQYIIIIMDSGLIRKRDMMVESIMYNTRRKRNENYDDDT